MKVSHLSAVLILTICSGCSSNGIDYDELSSRNYEKNLEDSTIKSLNICLARLSYFKENLILADKDDVKSDVLNYLTYMQEYWHERSEDSMVIYTDYQNKNDIKYYKQEAIVRGKSDAFDYCSNAARDSLYNASLYDKIDKVTMVEIIEQEENIIHSHQRSLRD